MTKLVDDVAAEMTKVIPASFANQAARAAIAVVARWLREKEKNFQDCDAQVAIRALAAHIEEGAKG